MKWFRMAAGLVGVVLAVANTLSVQGGNPDPSAVKQEKAEKSSKFEGRWIVVSSTVDGDGQDMQGDKVHIAKGKITLEEQAATCRSARTKPTRPRSRTSIDVTPTQGKDKGKVHKGILILRGKPAQALPGPPWRRSTYRGVVTGRLGPHPARARACQVRTLMAGWHRYAVVLAPRTLIQSESDAASFGRLRGRQGVAAGSGGAGVHESSR